MVTAFYCILLFVRDVMTVLVKSSLFVHTMTNYTQFLYCPLLDFSTFLMVFHSLRLPSLRSFLILSTRFHSLVLLAPSRLHPLPFHLQLLDLLSLDFLLYHTRSIYIFSIFLSSPPDFLLHFQHHL